MTIDEHKALMPQDDGCTAFVAGMGGLLVESRDRTDGPLTSITHEVHCQPARTHSDAMRDRAASADKIWGDMQRRVGRLGWHFEVRYDCALASAWLDDLRPDRKKRAVSSNDPGAHPLAARAASAVEGTREPIRRFHRIATCAPLGKWEGGPAAVVSEIDETLVDLRCASHDLRAAFTASRCAPKYLRAALGAFDDAERLLLLERSECLARPATA